MMKTKIFLTFWALTLIPLARGQQPNELQYLATRAIAISHKVQIQQEMAQKARIDKSKAWAAYLPKIGVDAAYTYLDGPLEYSQDMQNLLTVTQRALIKEQAAMQTYALPAGHPAKVEFGSPYQTTNADGTTALTPLGQLAANNIKPIPPIQVQEFFKANVNAQMLLFSGLKVPYMLSAAKHQMAANDLMVQSEISKTLLSVMSTYDQLAILEQSRAVIDKTEAALQNQKKLIDKLYTNGLTTNINQQKIDIALEQLKGKRIELDNAKTLMAMRMESLTGMPADSVTMVKPSLSVWTVQPYGQTSADRPEIKALDEAIVATGYKKKADYAEYVPKIVAFGKKELVTDNLTMLDPEWYVGVGLKWTVFDGLTAKHAASQSKIDQNILMHKRDEALELSEIKKQRDWLEVQKCNQMIATAQRQVELTQNVVHLSQRQFEEGLATLNEHLASLNDAEKAQLELIQQVAKQRMATAEYLQSIGQLSIENLQ
jgi:outer membrane protein TolC